MSSEETVNFCCKKKVRLFIILLVIFSLVSKFLLYSFIIFKYTGFITNMSMLVIIGLLFFDKKTLIVTKCSDYFYKYFITVVVLQKLAEM